MGDTNQAKASLSNVLEVGLTIQTITTIITFAIKKDKSEFLTEFNKLISSFTLSLSDEEKAELSSDVETMVQQKADDFVTSTEKKLGKDKLNEVIDLLK